MAVRFGMISAVMMRHVLSPLAREASTKSRRRSDSVWARSTRAPQAQPVTAITSGDRDTTHRRQLAGDDDDERQLRDDQEDVGQHGQALVADPADVARGHADEHADRGGADAGDQTDDHHAAGAEDDLGQDVLPQLVGAQPVRGRRRLQQVGAQGAGVVRDDPRADDRQDHEEREDDESRQGLRVAQEDEPLLAGGRGLRGRDVRRVFQERQVDGHVSPPAGSAGRARRRRSRQRCWRRGRPW